MGFDGDYQINNISGKFINGDANYHAANFIAIAHNQNDSIETFFLNLTRGSGIKGLQGIRPISGTIIRPLVTVSREEIVTYANTNHLNYRTDSTNLTDIYRRNFIRHNIIPLFEELNPSFASTMMNC